MRTAEPSLTPVDPRSDLPASLTVLTKADYPALSRFEYDNRDWFEASIEGRGDDFYTPAAIAAHLAECLEGYRLGRFYPGIIKDRQGAILGRANLHGIDGAEGNAYVGYRIAKAHSGLGLATMAVAGLIQQAYGSYGLRQLTAFAAVDNRASVRILEKHHFEPVETLRALVRVQDMKKDCFRFIHRPSGR